MPGNTQETMSMVEHGNQSPRSPQSRSESSRKPGRALDLLMVYGMAVFGYFMSCAVVFIQGRQGTVAGNCQAGDVEEESDV